MKLAFISPENSFIAAVANRQENSTGIYPAADLLLMTRRMAMIRTVANA
ncbi:MAG TPA: hypothetical protein VHC44_18465 [Verrucomicrobiae bacterium]|nr:hypothetical protein [Verrucomicrobiae bacterium]